MPVHSFDQSTGARARRRRRHDAMVRELFQEAQYRRQTRLLLSFVVAIVLVALGALVSAAGWW